ncbi:ATP-binding cassette domain-containing protein [Spiroplasma tabanidicola]|uniref:ABC transporter ATP-binding protein n=1 Tax=Spiroplasma tabanidicola TaxID=324079 RepID=A0A6I6C9N7_9MOLU|nr:ABC transporter ATP-binding protein [Spiroplasma tabanidicola]QGS52296.1 ABC transporter ATP-binding protein [Spiroplasma tabanidicola]
MIKIKNLKKTYNNKTVLNVENLTLDQNQCIGIMGKNGAGKTTLVEIIMGSKKQNEGDVIIDKTDLRKNAVFQECQYEQDLNLITIARFYKKLFKSNEDLEVLFEKFELKEFKRKRFIKLSGGEKQKFKLLIAFVNKPNLLLLDELTTSLDFIWREKIYDVLNDYIKENKTTILMVSHDVNEVAKLCQRVIFINDGIVKKDLNLNKDIKENIEILEKEVISCYK